MPEDWKEYEIAQFREIAGSYGICDEDVFFRLLRKCGTKAESIYIYKHCLDWCLDAGYPDLDFLRREYRNEETERDGVYFDKTFDGELLDEHQTYVFHHCAGRIRVAMNCGKAVIPMLYFAYGCDMEVSCTQENYGRPIRVPLYIFGENRIEARDDGHARYVRYEKPITKKP